MAESKLEKVRINGYFKTGTSLRGGENWAYASSLEDKKKNFLMICDLVDRSACKYGKMKDEIVFLKIGRSNLYPLKNRSVIYEIRGEGGGEILKTDDQLNVYRDNKRDIFIYFVFAIIPSIFFSFMVLIKRRVKNY